MLLLIFQIVKMSFIIHEITYAHRVELYLENVMDKETIMLLITITLLILLRSGNSSV